MKIDKDSILGLLTEKYTDIAFKTVEFMNLINEKFTLIA